VAREKLLQLPVAHDALSARLIEQAGFKAFQIGGFALEAALYGFRDIDLTHLGENSLAVLRIMRATPPALSRDGDDGYGDAKNVTHMVETYESMGAAALFLEDQKPPRNAATWPVRLSCQRTPWSRRSRRPCKRASMQKRCSSWARTDARQPEGVDDAIRRCELYLKAGADGVYVEGPKTEK
jgi:methylisocitrate lyase